MRGRLGGERMSQEKYPAPHASPEQRRLERQLRRVENLIAAVAARHGLGHCRCLEVAERFLELAARLRQTLESEQRRAQPGDTTVLQHKNDVLELDHDLIRIQFERIREILSEQENDTAVYRRMMESFSVLDKTHQRYFLRSQNGRSLGVSAGA